MTDSTTTPARKAAEEIRDWILNPKSLSAAKTTDDAQEQAITEWETIINKHVHAQRVVDPEDAICVACGTTIHALESLQGKAPES